MGMEIDSPIKLAGFWVRFVAFLLDALLVMAAIVILGLFFGGRGEILYILIILLYYMLLPATPLQGTVGKYFIGLRIVDNDGNRLTFPRSIARYFSYFFSNFFFVGYIMVGARVDKRGLHDLICKTKVISVTKTANVLVTTADK
ncbi:RDD family protein [Bacillus alkalicellulosilyticus]|uniref:RDD family protein n=1 Tax=Alkalihalobacterium alkalicellulosilyticum TaxID=1912214 RepID=UPI0009970184|nr:RDD family protein [Bacillus alkalicellulosilyticus]